MFEKRHVSPMYFLGLLYLVFPIFFNLDNPYLPVISVATAIFGLAYISILFSKSKTYELLAWCVCLAYIIYMTFWGNIQFSLFLFNLSNLLTWHYQQEMLSFRTITYGLTLLAVLVWSLVGGFSLEIILFMFVLHLFGVFMLVGGRLQSQKEAAEKKLMEQNASINLLLAETERNRIGQDLHDTLGHVFAMLAVKAELAETLLANDQITPAKQEVAAIHTLAKDAMHQVRQIVQSLKDTTVAEEIQIVQQMLELAGVSCQVTGLEAFLDLPLATQGKLAMVLRELTTNLLKHSQATECRLTFSQQKDQYQLDYEDNGIGFAQVDGTELASIKNRMTTIEGQVALVSAQQPTAICLTIPRKEL